MYWNKWIQIGVHLSLLYKKKNWSTVEYRKSHHILCCILHCQDLLNVYSWQWTFHLHNNIIMCVIYLCSLPILSCTFCTGWSVRKHFIVTLTFTYLMHLCFYLDLDISSVFHCTKHHEYKSLQLSSSLHSLLHCSMLACTRLNLFYLLYH